MEAAPFQEPAETMSQKEPMLEAVSEAIEALGPRERWIIEAVFWRGLSYRQIERELSLAKSHVHRIAHSAMRQMGEALKDHPAIVVRLGQMVDEIGAADIKGAHNESEEA